MQLVNKVEILQDGNYKSTGERNIPPKLNVKKKRKITCKGSEVFEVRGNGRVSWVLLLYFVHTERVRERGWEREMERCIHESWL